MLSQIHKNHTIVTLLKIFFFIYILLCAVNLIIFAFSCFGENFAHLMVRVTDNPFVGLFLGTLVTSLIHSSSSTTSIVVGMVAAGVLTVRNAVPIIMGANIGTTVTNITVSLAYVTRKEEFKRAFAGALIHDLFNVFTVIIILPIELHTHILEKTATFFALHTLGHKSFDLINPIKPLTQPVVSACRYLCTNICGLTLFKSSFILLPVALIFLFTALFFISRYTREIMKDKTENMIDKALARSGWFGILIGLVITAIIQSSSITTSIMVPLIGAGILSLESAFPITMGANLGTTVTAILASLTGNVSGVIIAFVHFFFNVFGIVIIYPFAFIRRIPIKIARFIAVNATEYRKTAVVCILLFFYFIPGILACWFNMRYK